MMHSFIGAENIISPLTEGASENFDMIYSGKSAVQLHKGVGIQNEDLYISKFNYSIDLTELIVSSISNSLEEYKWKNSKRSLLILSTTKGEIEYLKTNDIDEARLSVLLDKVVQKINFKGDSIVLSNACISGVLGLVQAHDFIQSDCYDEVIVCGGDLASLFTISGFQSFFAISSEPSKPFDKNRKGINLGEGAACIILSNDKSQFKAYHSIRLCLE